MAEAKKTYTPQFKFQVVLESLKNERSDAEIARLYGVHPITLSNWKRHFLEHGVEVFGGSEAMRRENVERPGGKSSSRVGTVGGSEGGGDRPPSKFSQRALTVDAKVELVNAHREEHGLNACLRALKVSKGLWHSRQKRQTLDARDARLKASIVSVIESHPDYGYRRIRAELRERGIRVNHKRLRRVLRSYDLGLRRCLPASKPSPIQRLVKEAGSSADLVKGRSFGILGAFSTDFTEILYAYGTKKAWWMALLDISSRWVGGWDDRLKKEEVGPSRNRALALASLNDLAEGMDTYHRDLEGAVIHHDQDSVYTSYAWLEEVLIERKAHRAPIRRALLLGTWRERQSVDRVLLSRSSSSRSPFKTENAGLCWETTTLDELRQVLGQQIAYYNTERRHSGLDYRRPEETLTRFIQEGKASANLSPT